MKTTKRMLAAYINTRGAHVEVKDLTNRKVAEIRIEFRKMLNDKEGQNLRGCYFWDALPHRIMRIIFPPIVNDKGFSTIPENYTTGTEFGSSEYVDTIIDGVIHKLGYHQYAYLYGPMDYGMITKLLDNRSIYHQLTATKEFISLLKHL